MREVLKRLNEKKVELEEDIADLEAELEKVRDRLDFINELIDEEEVADEEEHARTVTTEYIGANV